MSKPPLILIVAPDEMTTALAKEALRDKDVRLLSVHKGEDALEALPQQSFRAVICDLDLDAGGGFALLKEVQRNYPRLPVIALSVSKDSSMAIESVKAGAFDFLPKPIHPPDLVRVVQEAISCSRKSSDPVAIDPENEFAESTDSLIGKSRAMLDVYKLLGRLSPTPVTVLIRGETGTGKELIARALFQHGHRAHKPFITLNCAAIPENLLESELFGHEKGSFTGAVSARIGKFEQANGATLFLDEIGDLNHSLQAKLLRVLQEKRFQRVGGNDEILADVRIIAATHRPLEKMISEGEFREDLFYRLNVATLKVPPLRDRTGDVELLTRYFLRRFSAELGLPAAPISRPALSRLESASLPGNVRQLQNVIRKGLLRSRGYPIERVLVEELLLETGGGENPAGEEETLTTLCRRLLEEARADDGGNVHQVALDKLETTLLREALAQSGGNISQASRWLGLSRLTLREKAKKYGLLVRRRQSDHDVKSGSKLPGG